jgi:two-component system, OmpR family, sensor kinase
MSLRARLLAGLLALVTAGLAVSGTVVYRALEDSLRRRVDQQLEQSRTAVLTELARGERFGLPFSSGRTVIPSGTFGEWRRPDGAVLRYLERTRPVPTLPSPMEEGERFFTVGSDRSEVDYRVMSTSLPDNGTLVVALPLDDVEQTLHRLLRTEVVVAAAVLILLTALALWVVRLGLRPLERIGATAGAIAGGDLSRRVEPAEPRTEIGRLGLSLNAMLGQIEEAFAERRASEDRLRRFVADASHELRTPLTAIRGYAELFRRGAAERPEDLARAMRRIEEESARMGGLVEDLLLLARLDQGRPLERSSVDLVPVAADAIADLRVLEPDRPVSFEHPDTLAVTGDEARLRQVVGNLLDNARRHTPAATPVHVRLGAHDSGIRLEVADEGPGLSPGEAERVFERFYRSDPARARATGGAGLGLSIVAAIVTAHGGSVEAGAGPDGRGAHFVVDLPVDAT